MKHLKLFKTQTEFDSTALELPNVSYVEEIGKIFHTSVINYYSKLYFTIEALEDGLTASLSGENDLEYCIDRGDWKILPANTYTESINTGQTLSFRGFIEPFGPSGPPKTSGQFMIEKRCNLKGNIMSLFFGDNFIDKTDISGKTMRYLFTLTSVIDASNLIMPAVTLSSYCYSYMFKDCTSLTKAPQLLATTLTDACYEYMFSGCVNLIQAPKVLPANMIILYCYNNMFKGCTNLTKSPEILATEVFGPSCFLSMFEDCTNLIKGPSSLSVFYTAGKQPGPYVFANMFKNCVNLTESPILGTTRLGPFAYANMFEGCVKLNKITMLATDISSTNCLNSWVSGVPSKGIFIKHPDMTSLPTGTSGIPSGWIVQDYLSNTPSEPFNDYEYVDLGLPSGTLWATMNVGATSPEEYGGLYAWGEIAEKHNLGWNNYKWYNGSENTITKYCTNSNYGTVDNKTALDLEDDVAHFTWGGDWRMPTKAELNELYNNCTWTGTTRNGVNGCDVISKKNGNRIFLPYSGYRNNTVTTAKDFAGYYWSSSLRSDGGSYADYLVFGEDARGWTGSRNGGQSVRPVKSKNN